MVDLLGGVSSMVSERKGRMVSGGACAQPISYLCLPLAAGARAASVSYACALLLFPKAHDCAVCGEILVQICCGGLQRFTPGCVVLC
jgi:hypothetical protein